MCSARAASRTDPSSAASSAHARERLLRVAEPRDVQQHDPDPQEALDPQRGLVVSSRRARSSVGQLRGGGVDLASEPCFPPRGLVRRANASASGRRLRRRAPLLPRGSDRPRLARPCFATTFPSAISASQRIDSSSSPAASSATSSSSSPASRSSPRPTRACAIFRRKRELGRYGRRRPRGREPG